MESQELLWQNFAGGRKSALSKIFMLYYDDLFRYGFRLCHDKEMVKDCIQDLFLKLWKNRMNLGYVHVIKSYLFKSLRNHLLDNLEIEKPNLKVRIEKEPFVIEYKIEDFKENDHLDIQTTIKLTKALNELPVRQREVIYLKYFQNLDIESISKITGISNQSVRNAMHRGMEALRELMLINVFFLYYMDSLLYR